ncbi:MAG: ADP-heptose--LPS heptosyltransferase [Caballeronia sp.]|uniref:glycosyltransferase family 9 protein n=1 Tax=Caballeronia sp. TaxID=1931223 RepID=UPI0026204002|nr:ADP-heptose--LPS heptosyltransferase [Caballeronia sp.]MDB5837653.1 ADP-heptose--LPS heptosyltransferase [Caballeronia sp.]
MLLDAASALTNPGSLLSPHGEIVASYDLEVSNSAAEGYRALGLSNGICNAALVEFNPDYAAASRVHVINGMGVTLGDSVIGLTALIAIKARFPHLSFTIYRPAHAPGYVKRIYELAAPLLGSVIDLPVILDTLPYTELRIDLGNHLFWPKFSSLPMIDFFLDAMGIKADEVPAMDKRNHWLQALVLPRPQAVKGDYVLLCPTASTPVRSIPASMNKDFVEALWQRYRLPVAGFGNLDHMVYTDVTSRAPDTADFLAWIKHAAYLVTPDTAAVHVAAGFDIPTTAFFTTIAPDLRVRDYPFCKPVSLPVPELEGIQASNRASDVERVERAYRALKIDVDFSGFA